MDDRPENSVPVPAPRGELLPAFGELRPVLDDGDLLLFSGESRFSRGIKRLTGGRWSHVGMVGRGTATGRLLLWEATADTELADVTTHEITPGVQLYDLEEWITHYGGKTAIRRLNVERTAPMRAALRTAYAELKGRPYQQGKLELLRAVWDGLFLTKNRRANLSSLYCAELVAEAYQRMGLLGRSPPSNEYTPRDFSIDRKSPLALLLEASLGPEIVVCAGATA